MTDGIDVWEPQEGLDAEWMACHGGAEGRGMHMEACTHQTALKEVTFGSCQIYLSLAFCLIEFLLRGQAELIINCG